MLQQQRKIWTQEEEEALRQLYEDEAERNWSNIAKRLTNEFGFPRKSAKQCRQRYDNHIYSDGVHMEWQAEEEQKLIELHDLIGNKWSVIAQQLSGKSDNCVKNHFYSRLRKSLRKLNSVIHLHMRKQFRLINISIIYKIVQATEQRFKEKPSCDEAVSHVCQDVQNRMLQIAIKEEEENAPFKIYTDLIKDIFSVNKLYKRKSKKTRNAIIKAPSRPRKKKDREAQVKLEDEGDIIQRQNVGRQNEVGVQSDEIKDILREVGILKEEEQGSIRKTDIRPQEFRNISSVNNISERNIENFFFEESPVIDGKLGKKHTQSYQNMFEDAGADIQDDYPVPYKEDIDESDNNLY